MRGKAAACEKRAALAVTGGSAPFALRPRLPWGAGQAVQREQCIQQVPDGHRACKDVFHAPKRSFRAGGLARENKNVYTQYKEKETGEPDGAEIIGLKPKRRFSACQKIRQPKRKDLGIY